MDSRLRRDRLTTTTTDRKATVMPYATHLLVALALVASAVLATIGSELPAQAWALVGLMVGAAVKRPGDLTADDLARELEGAEPTIGA